MDKKDRLKKVWLACQVLLLATLSCGPVSQTITPHPTQIISTSNSSTPLIIGVEYSILGGAQEYSATGISYAKVQNAFAIWGNIEPQRGHYHWGPLDAMVREYQQAGFTGLQIDLTALSPWASSKSPTVGDQGDTLPKEEYLPDYVAFVSAVVERYDHDGVNDMPGLLYPIHDYGIDREFSGFWPGTSDEYIRLLRIAYPAIKAADPQAYVMLVALLMTDVFDRNPSPVGINQRLATTPTYMRKSASDIRAILSACDAYDTIDFHSLGNYTEIPLTVAWIRSELNANGCGQKPIWIGDAFPMSGLIGYGGFVPPIPFAPVTRDTRDVIVSILSAMADPTSPNIKTSQTWFYAEEAINLVRKIVVAAGEGIRGINLGNLEDWRTGVTAVDKASVPLLGASLFMGMTDTTITNQKPGGDLPFNGQSWSKARQASKPRPVYHALSLAIQKIGKYTSVITLSLGNNTWAYQFSTASGPIWVIWYDDGSLYLPGQTPPDETVRLPLTAASAIITLTPTDTNQNQPETKILSSSGGVFSFTVSSTPIFIESAAQ